MDLQSREKQSRIHNMNTNTQINSLAQAAVQKINDEVYTSLLDSDWDPEEAYQVAFHSTWDFEAEPPVDEAILDLVPSYVASDF